MFSFISPAESDYSSNTIFSFDDLKTDIATEKRHINGEFTQKIAAKNNVERFVDETEEGVLIHAKTTVPAETYSRESLCTLNAPSHCLVGISCPDELPFIDELHQNNVFHDENGKFCNCWMNRKVQKFWVPRLVKAMEKLSHE